MQEREAHGATAAAAAVAAGGAKEYVPLPLIGQIREKGFSTSESSSRHWHRVSAPEPRTMPFPVARHRSDGPHWAPSQAVQSVSNAKEDWEDDNGEQLASNAQPLVRKQKNTINFSKWKTENVQKEALDLGTQLNVSASNLDKHNVEEDRMVTTARSTTKDVEDHVASSEHCARSVAVDSRPVSTSTFSREYNTESPRRVAEDISSVNESTLEGMTIEQIAEAQQELVERFRPDILDMLRRRGKKKAEKQISSESNLDTCSENPVSSMPKVGKKSFEEPKQREDAYAAGSTAQGPPPSIAQEKFTDQFSWGGRSWTERVEAVRLFCFGLDGNVVGIGSASALPSTGDKDSQWRIPNVTERDFLRMEGDPSSHGYTIKEAVALARSMVPAQRSAALRLLGNILNKAMVSLQSSIGDESICLDQTLTESVDWQAVWAYALGPEPELVLTLRMALDDSHATAVITCARALEFLLSSSANENYFNLYESLLPGDSYMFTAPVFQKSMFKESGLIGDCYWKYNVKPTDMFPFSKNSNSQGEDDATVKDDASIANHDIAAGLIRMGILPRIRYLLEVERLTSAEDSIFNILIALSRHSPAAADAVMKCPRLMDTIRQLLVLDESLTWPARPKAIRLLKVLSIASKSNCIQLLNLGIFESSQHGLLRQGLTLGKPKRNQEGRSWVELVESLDFWRICISYGLCIPCFSDFYPALLFWIATPVVRQPIQATLDVKDAILAEVSFHLLEALAGTLPILHGKEEVEMNTLNLSPNIWSWKFAIPIVENSLGWLSFDFAHSCTESLPWCDDGHNPSKLGTDTCLRIMASVLHFLSNVCERILEEGSSGSLWLPTFVPKLGLQLVKSGLLGFRNFDSGSSSLVKCYLESKEKASGKYLLEARNCLGGLVRLLKVLDRLLASVKVDKESNGACKIDEYLGAEEILKCGLILSAKEELMQLLRATGDDLIKKSGVLNMVDTSRRGGPTPGIGIGWGCQGGGHWSHQVLAAQIESTLVLELMELLNVKESPSEVLLHEYEDSSGPIESWKIKVGFSVSLLASPCHKDLVERVCCDIILNESSLYFYLKKTGPLLKKWFSKIEKDKNLQEIQNHLDNLCRKVEDIRHTLLQHVKSIWLCQKVKSTSAEGGFIDEKHAREYKSSKRGSILSTVPEDSASMSASYDRESLAVEWAGQKLPLPSFWFWSPLLSNGNLTMGGDTDKTRCTVSGLVSADIGEVIRHGLLLLFGLEALEEYSPPLGFKVPVARKIHALSSIFVISDDVFLESSVSSMVGALQEMYMYQLDSNSEEKMAEIDMKEQYAPAESAKKDVVQKLDFETLVDERYLSFLDKLTNQFASVSYGDLVFSRQVAIYLRRDVSESLRLRVWKSLESEHMLEFLPPLEKCCGPCTMYLYPTEESQELLKAYASAWASGALDRAIIRQSLSFSLAVSHVASYIFNKTDRDQMIASHKTFAKSFLLQLAQRSQFQESLVQLLNCKVPVEPIPCGVEGTFRPPSCDEIKMRCIFLEEACANYSHLVDRIHQFRRSLK